MQSPVLVRLKQKGPSFCLLKRPRVITEEDLEVFPKWGTILEWYRAIEEDPNHDWVHQALHSMINAAIYQERIYFAVTRNTLTELFRKDSNWKRAISLSPKNYSFLLNEMVESGIFEAHPENERLKLQKKPMIFKVIDEAVLSFIKTTPESVQEKQVLDFVENCEEEEPGNNPGNNVGNNSGNTESKKVRKEESESSLAENKEEENQEKDSKITLNQYLLRHWQEWPRYDELENLIKYAIVNCSDFNNASYASKKFRKHLESASGKVTPARKKLISGLENKFKQYAEMYLDLMEANGVKTELQTPDESMFSSTKIAINEESTIQNNTIRILNASFGKENIQLLKRRLDNADNDSDKFVIQQEIDFWESVIYEGR